MTDRSIKELESAYLSDAAAGEFDTYIARFNRKKRIRRTAFCGAALMIAIVVTINLRTQDVQPLPEITTVELMETISALTESDLDEISSIVAKPRRHDIVVTAEFRSGITKTYLMKRGADGSSIEMTAQNLE